MKRLPAAALLSLVALAGCDGERAPTQTPEPAVTQEDSGPHMCMPCVGPHITMGGKLKVFSFGPGVGL